MSAALDLVPLLGAVGTACGAVGGVVGAWVRGRAKATVAVAVSHSREVVAVEETGRHEIADRADHNAALMRRLAALEERSDRCHEDNAEMRVLLVQAGHDLEQVRDEVREANARAERAEERCAVLEDQLLRWHGALPAGSD